ncbi:MAG: CcdB family protein [Hahellaceae bacterium]|nr:CcdB family protein [Hahellaceae bacterium]
MSQFCLYRNEDKATQQTYPYFLNVQNDLLDELNSRVVIPLSSLASVQHRDAKRLCPVLNIEGADYVLLTHQISTIPKFNLKTMISDLKEFRQEIVASLDLLITGI